MHKYSLRFALCALDPISELRLSRILIMLMLWLYDIFRKFLFIKQGMSIDRHYYLCKVLSNNFNLTFVY